MSFLSSTTAYDVADGNPVQAADGQASIFGVAIDVTKKDGTRTLLVPNIKQRKQASLLPSFFTAYDDVVKRAREGKLQIADFQGTTISLTNPGTIGTVASTPRLMAGQSVIIATGAIEYPAEYQAMAPEALSQLGISKAITISSTYDHRIVQGAESGAFLRARARTIALASSDFTTTLLSISASLTCPSAGTSISNPSAWCRAINHDEQTTKEAGVIELINAYRVRGHLIADIDPLHAMPVLYHPELDIETYGLTIWDLDREFITGGSGRHGQSPRCARFSTSCNAPIAAKSASSIATSKARKKSFGSANRYAASWLNRSRFRSRSRSNCSGN